MLNAQCNRVGSDRISGSRILLSGQILNFARYPVSSNLPDIRCPVILPEYPAGYFIILKEKLN